MHAVVALTLPAVEADGVGFTRETSDPGAG